MTAKPLTMEELRECQDMNTHGYGLSQDDCDRLLATIRRRDELIRWLVEFHALEGSLTVLAANPTGCLPEEANKAAAVLEIVAAGKYRG